MMQNERKIHLVLRPEPQFLRPQLRVVARAKSRKRKPGTVGPQEIVRETLAIAWECREVLAAHPMSKDQLLVDLTYELPKVTPDQAEALVRLLARATKSGFLPSVADTFCLLDLIDGRLPPLQAEPEVEAGKVGAR
jgi:hypothetical protein